MSTPARGPLPRSRRRSSAKQSVLLRSAARPRSPQLSEVAPRSAAIVAARPRSPQLSEVAPRSAAIVAALWRSRPVVARSRIKIPDTHPLMFQFCVVDHIITG